MKILRLRSAALFALGLVISLSTANAATFNVTNPGDFQAALTAAQSNGENDTINVGVCSGTGCSGGAYVITTPLTYTAAASESFSLEIDGFDSDTRILSGGGVSAILRIDNSAPNDTGTQIAVRNMTLFNGNASGSGSAADGGALWLVAGGANIEITGSVYVDNVAADDGGAVFVRSEAAVEALVLIRDVTFEGNEALGSVGDGTGDGGAVHVAANLFNGVNVTDVDFIENAASGNGGGLEVEGLDPVDTQPQAGFVSIFDVGFTGNTAGDDGGGAAIAAGSIDMDRTGFVDNDANRGGGLHVRQNVQFFTMVNTGFTRNAAAENGGGLAIDRNMGPTISIAHNTVYNNSAVGNGAGMWIEVGGSTGLAQLFNNIVYDNQNAAAGRDVFIDNDPFSDIPAAVTFSYNDITDLTGFPDSSTAFFITSSAELTETNNIDAAPVLPNIALADPDPSQGPTSPTIDAGLNNPPGVFTSVDWEGDTRPQDGDGDGTATSDIGMDEFVPGALPQADLTIAKLASADPIVGGTDQTYSITVGNNGPDAASGVTVTDTLDSRLVFVSAAFDQGSPCTASGTPVVVTCVLGSLASGADATGTIVVTTPVLAEQVTITNVASVAGNESDPVSANDAASVDTVVVPPGPAMADLVLTKIASDNPFFSAGMELTYTLTVDNNGPATATGVVVTDTVPAGMTFVSATATTGPGCNGPDASGVVTCPLGDIANGSNATVFIVVIPDTVSEPTDITNTATVTANEEDPTPGDATASETVTVNPPSADMRLTVVASPEEPLVGETITYTITVVNDGPSDDTGVFVDVTLPAGVTLQSATSSVGTCDTSGDPIMCLIGDLASGASATVTVSVLAPDQPGTLLLEATVGGDIADPLQENNSGASQIDVIDEIDIVVRGVGGTGSIGPLGLALLLAAAAAVWLSRSRAPARTIVPLLFAGTLLAGLTAQNAQAQADWYVGASVGASDAGYSGGELQSDLAAAGWTVSDVSVDDTDTAWKVFGGFAINEYFAIEAGYADLGEVETRYAASVAPNRIDALLRDTANVHSYLGDGWFGVGVVRWPLVPEQWSLTGRAGVFAWEADIDIDVIEGASGSVGDKDTGTDVVYGVGIEWHANPQLSVTLEWERYRLNDWVDVPSAGLRWRF